nr:hypothetical protein [Tanacetum cinerariifolium]
MSFSKRSGKSTPQCYTKPLDSLKNWNNRFFWVDECVFPTVVNWRTNASKDGMLANGTYSVEAVTVRALDTHHSSGVLSAVEKSPLDFANEDGASDQGTTASEVPPPEDVPATAALEVGQSEGAIAAEPPVARESRKRGHDGIEASPPKLVRRDHASLRPSVTLIRYLLLMLRHTIQLTLPSVAAAGDPESENVSSPAEVGSPGSVYRPEWGVTNDSLLDTPEACQDLVDHAAPSEAGMKRAVEEKSAGLSQELERMCAQFSELQVSNECLSQQVDALQQQVSGEETLKAAFEDYKRHQDQLVEQRCAKIDARLDALSIDFDEELYPHMLTAIAGRRWVIGHGLRLAMMKCAESLKIRQAFTDVVYVGVAKGMSEGLKHGVEHGHAQLTVESLEAYDPEAEAKFAAALQSLKDMKYPLLDQLEGLKDAHMDVIIAALYLESDTGGECPTIYTRPPPQLLSAHHPRVPGVCRTHGVGSAHHARSDGVSVFVPTVVPQGLALLLVDAATQTDLEDA